VDLFDNHLSAGMKVRRPWTCAAAATRDWTRRLARRLRGAVLRFAFLACALAAAAEARAQLQQIPQLPLPQLQLRAVPLQLPANVSPAANIAAPPPADIELLHLQGQRKLRNLDKLRRYADRIGTDANGNLVLRDEIVAYLPSPAWLDRVREQGFQVLREHQLSGLNSIAAVLRPADNASIADALLRLRALFPDAAFDLNHLYDESGSGAGRRAGFDTLRNSGATRTARPRPSLAAAGSAAPPAKARRRIGLVDGGVDSGTEALRDIPIHRHGCLGRVVASAHGTAVASIMVGKTEKFNGAAPGAELYAADIYCGEPTGGAVDAIVAALAWLAGQHIPVVNVSLVGPANKVLEATVRGMIQRGHQIVAAVGNDGPAAPPLYPAAYPGVIGVTAVDAALRVLPEASRGPQVSFAAPGADMAAARIPSGYTAVRGTSYAAPVVAGLLALLLDKASPAAAQQALTRLIGTATDLGPPGKDPNYGYGLVGKEVRIDPAQLNLPDARR
jgi:hypothetical protein